MLAELKLKSLTAMGLFGAVLLTACSGFGSPPTPTAAPTPTPLPTVAPETDPETGEDTSSGLRTFVIVPQESEASYVVDEEFFAGALAKYGIEAGLVDTIGTTQEVEGQFRINFDDLSSPLADGHFSVNLATLTSDQSLRDNWIRENGPQFNQYPLAEFRATAVEGSPQSYTEGQEVQFKVRGDMTIREITQPVTLDVTAKLEGDTITGTATTRLLMSDFGIEPPNFANTLTVADEFDVQIDFTAVEREGMSDE